MRVVGGSSRGRRLAAPVPDVVRPTSDRVRESIFNILASMIDLHEMNVMDLFAGTGALGIEAMSRGAGAVTFVERDPDAAKAIRANLVHTGLDGPGATVVRRDVLDYLRATRRECSSAMAEQGSYDLVLCDPPYSFDLWSELIGVLPRCLCVLESGSELTVPEPWMVLRARRYGSTLVTVVRPQGDVEDDSPDDSGGVVK